jgi:3-hydroxyacyl-CoA dehydrogenase
LQEGSMSKIGIVGAGLIGRAWAIVFARAGYRVAVYDPVAGALEASLAAIDRSLMDLKRAGLVDDPAASRRCIAPVDTLAAALDGAHYVQECGPERVDDKRAIFAELDRLAAPGTILASSTSAILPSAFTESLVGRHRCLVAHPVNPPHLVPVVELCGAPWTAPETIEQARALLDAAGQVPVTVRREIDGFILNRLQAALLNEAFRLIDEGYVSPEDLDKTVAHGLGLRWSFMGPMETIDLNAPNGVVDYIARYGPFFRRLFEETKAAPFWSDGLAQTLEAARRADLPADQLSARQAWRDRRLMALLLHKERMEEQEADAD